MLKELQPLEPKLKQILYGCVEHVQATKAALYLTASLDLNDKTYEIVTSYQFSDPARRVVKGIDDVVDRLAVKRDAFFVNGLASETRFSEMMFRQGNDRFLASPLFARGRMVGFIDMRDKAGRKPFEPADLVEAKSIGDQVLALLSSHGLFGLAPIPVEQTESPASLRASMPTLAIPRVVEPAPPSTDERGEPSPEARRAIEAARATMARRQHSQLNSGKRLVGDEDLEGARLLLPAALAIPGTIVAALTVTRGVSEPQSILSISTLTAEANEALQKHIRSWLQRANQPLTAPIAPRISYPFGAHVEAITSSRIAALASAAVNTRSLDGLVLLTLGFDRPPEPQSQRAIRLFLRQLEQAIDASAASRDRQAVAEKLLEPDFQKFPELADHTRQVSTIAHLFALSLDLPRSEAETIRIAGLVHDIGLRLLDYDRLYRRPNLTGEELRMMAEHPIIGAALIEPLLGNEIAQIVLRHHERVDGKGYPSRMTGNNIPMGSRIIQICDAWVAMTARHSYQAPFSAADAAHRIREGAGTQFDDALVQRFLSVIDELTA